VKKNYGFSDLSKMRGWSNSYYQENIEIRLYSIKKFKLARQSGERIPDAPEVAGDQRRRRKLGIVSIGRQR
jgi:hypothetical protein